VTLAPHSSAVPGSSSTKRNLVDAVLSEVATNGIDALSVSGLSDAVGISRPTFYSRFGNIDGLLAEAWLDASEQWCDSLVAPEFEPRDTAIALAKIFASARRKPEVAEIVWPVFRRWWTTTSMDFHPGPLSWLVANRLGVLLTTEVVPEVQHTLMIDPLLFSHSTISELPRNDSAIQDFSIDPIQLDDPILQAVLGVVATSGYQGTSMSRIARAVRMTTGALYPQFTNAEELLRLVYAAAQTQVVEKNAGLWERLGLTQESFGRFIVEGLTPARAQWRGLRLETLLGGIADPTIRTMTEDALKAMAVNLGPIMAFAAVPDFAKPAISYIFHTLGVGFSVLDEAGIDVAELDHVGVATLVAQSLAEAGS